MDEYLFDNKDLAYTFVLMTLNKFCEENDYSLQGFLTNRFKSKSMSCNFMNFLRNNQVPSPHYFRKMGLYSPEVCDWLEWHKVNMPHYKRANVRDKDCANIIKKWRNAEEPPCPDIVLKYSETGVEDFEIEDLHEEKKGKEYWLARAWELDAQQATENGIT